MTSFSQLSCEQLIRREGFDCACGRHHVCALDYLKIGSGAVRYAADMLRAMGCEKPYILCDKNTWAAAGGQVTASLDAAGISYTVHMIPGERPAPAEWEVGSALLHYDSSCDAVMGVGSGVINDISKVLSHAVGVKSCIVGTAPSMDGYASDSAAMEIDQVKSTLFVNVPRGILLDTDILAQAPMRMLQAGFGDVLAKFTALSEWQIARIVNGEAYCDEIAALMRTALDRVVAAVPGIPARDPESVRSIAEGLVISGIAMAFAGVSRPASGQEHYFSHMWEMMALERGKPYDLHGIQVGVGTLLTIAICERLRKITPDRERAERMIASFDRAQWERQVRRIFGKTADEILAIEEKTHKNDPAAHRVRLERIISRWEEIRAILRTLPDRATVESWMTQAGMPKTPADLALTLQDAADAWTGSRDARGKYLLSSMLWDMGLQEEIAEEIRSGRIG